MTNLLESLLSSEFTFGFELEAYVSPETLEKYNVENRTGLSNEEIWGLTDTDEESHWDNNQSFDEDDTEYDIQTLYSDLEYNFSDFFGSNIEIVHDDSLGEGGFEFPTPPMNLTPKNIQYCIDFLDTCLNKWEISTDESCGFHVHFAFPQMNEKDMAWIICQISLNDNYINSLTKFNTEYGSFEFLSNWAHTKYLYNIKKCIIEKNGMPDFKELSSLLSSEKYRLIRIHPQGTLEWRGPRNFMNDKNIKNIKQFFYNLLKISQIFAKCMDKKYLGDYISRSSFDKMVDFSNIDKKEKDLSSSNETIDKIARQAIKNPLILTKIKDYSKFDYASLMSTIEAIYSTCTKSSINDLFIELRYKKFNSSKMLAELIKTNPEFINYVEDGLSKALKNIFYTYGNKYLNLYMLIGKVKSINPSTFREIANIIHKIKPTQALNDYVSAFKSFNDTSCLHNRNIIKIMADIYTFDKLDQRFAKKGLILTNYIN